MHIRTGETESTLPASSSNLACALFNGMFYRYDQIRPDGCRDGAQFTRHDVEKSSIDYVLLDRRTSSPFARLRPIYGTDRFELFYSSDAKRHRTAFEKSVPSR